MDFGLFWDRLSVPLGIERSLKCHKKYMRKLASEKVGSEEARLPKSVPGWCQKGFKGGGKPPPLGVGVSEERKKESNQVRRKGR